ncbi:N-acetylglucosaminylphosphatidylinositol deacetylase [Malassezia sp. CBS 17886]|nr:N-acetylglucosaminylphosphatidylinositol deacetylase [Malassezia sp. CBS 17886]
MRAHGGAAARHLAATALAVAAIAVLLRALAALQASVAGVYCEAGGACAPPARHALIVTAHPDDECMFFGPTIAALLQHNISVSALCLSMGNADGLGDTRVRELTESYGVLGVPAEKVSWWDDAQLQDGMSTPWDPAHIGVRLRRYLAAADVDLIVTFDASGVSWHGNHIATHHGVLAPPAGKQAVCHTTPTSAPRLLLLRTLSPPTKFTGRLWSLVQWRRRGRPSEVTVLAPYATYRRTVDAMHAHKTQLVWFRYVYLALSTYMHANVLEQVADGRHGGV